MHRRVILDTDIGDNIDDAIALYYLLAQPACRLLGITTVESEHLDRADLARRLCLAADRPDVPVVAGAEQTTTFLSETVRQHPNQVTLLAIGPLTNVARAFSGDRALPGLLQRLLLMGGSFGINPEVERIEHNVATDPRAASCVYGSDVRAHQSVGLDVTRATRARSDALPAILGPRAPRLLCDWVARWLADKESVVFNDPLAVASLFERGLCTFDRGAVTVAVDGDDRGLARWSRDARGPHEVATRVDSERFFQHLSATLAGQRLYH